MCFGIRVHTCADVALVRERCMPSVLFSLRNVPCLKSLCLWLCCGVMPLRTLRTLCMLRALRTLLSPAGNLSTPRIPHASFKLCNMLTPRPFFFLANMLKPHMHTSRVRWQTLHAHGLFFYDAKPACLLAFQVATKYGSACGGARRLRHCPPHTASPPSKGEM